MLNIAIAGPMASGKTTVGKKLAQKLRRPFVDVDQFIEDSTGEKVSEIFAKYGESYFRKLEEEAIERLSELRGIVIALGGGAVISSKNREILGSSGIIVMLSASPEEILRRVGEDSTRPLLAGDGKLERITALLKEREDYYKSGDLYLDTTQLSPDQAVDKICAFLGKFNMPDNHSVEQIVEVEVSPPYSIHIGAGILAKTGRIVSALAPGSRAIIITNPLLSQLYGYRLEKILSRHGISAIQYKIGDGEQFKEMDQVMSVYDFMASHGMGRDTILIALGGGVVGDLAGFVAATYMRGIRFIQVPTTLLAQVDSSVGGKVAINHPRAKNLIGAFYQPAAVIADVGTLLSLSEREYREGLAEVVKYGVIWDSHFFTYLEKNVEAILRRDTDILTDLVYRCCCIKAEVVSQDERDHGIRAYLNFGHTIGHAIEALAGYGTLRHGEAISLGMVAAMRLAIRLGLAPAAGLTKLERLLGGFGLPIEIREHLGQVREQTALAEKRSQVIQELMDHMALDKKAKGGKLRFILPRRIGEVMEMEISDDVIRSFLEELL